jgi:chromatin modification-related protein EAF6
LATTGSATTELTKLLEKKQTVDQKLASLERQIYALEGSYLQDTRNLGNILTGWDSYLSSRGSGALKRPQKFKESDRLFSLSSLTSVKVIVYDSLFFK